MAVSEGLLSRQDFEEAVAEVGQTVKFTRPAYEDAKGTWHKVKSWNARCIAQGVNTAQPYSVREVGVNDNAASNDAHYLYIPYSAGEAWASDVPEFNGVTWTLSNPNRIVVDDEIVCYYALVVRLHV